MMHDQSLDSQLASSQVRREWHNGEWYYNATDVIQIFTNGKPRQAQNYYHALKYRIMMDGNSLSGLVRLKTKCADGKSYSCDFINREGVENIYTIVSPNAAKREKRIHIRKDDEVANFHPLVIEGLSNRGFTVEHHVHLPSGAIVDIVATRGNRILVVECKPQLQLSKFFSAVGQVLCYRAEFGEAAQPCIACYVDSVNEYILARCNELSIRLIPVPV